MIFYVKYDPFNEKITDYTDKFDYDKVHKYVVIDIYKKYEDETTYIGYSLNNQSKGLRNRQSSYKIYIKNIQSKLIEEIRENKINNILNI